MARIECALILAALLAGCGAPDFAFDPDEEEGAHETPVERWFHHGRLSDETGTEWVWISIFPRDAAPVCRIIDPKTGVSDPAEDGAAFERTGPGTYRLHAGDVNLELRAVSPFLAIEGTGLTGLLVPEEVCIYAVPRLEASGTMYGRKVSGLFWYDHQWGISRLDKGVAWCRWGLQLEDGTDASACIFRDLETGRVYHSTVTHAGKVHPLEAAPVTWWESPKGVHYPVAWDLTGGPLKLRVEPILQEGALKGHALWAGPVRLQGSHAGFGFQELAGYGKGEQENR
jgi:hypothetical protein